MKDQSRIFCVVVVGDFNHEAIVTQHDEESVLEQVFRLSIGRESVHASKTKVRRIFSVDAKGIVTHYDLVMNGTLKLIPQAQEEKAHV